MLACLTAKELRDWEAVYQVEPWGELRADLRHGIACSLMDACHRQKGQPLPPSAYMPFAKGEPKVQSKEEQKAVVARIQKAFAKQRKAR